MTPFLFILLSLVIFRLSVMIAKENGPCNIFWQARNWIGKRNEPGWINFYELITCPWCVSVWISWLVMTWACVILHNEVSMWMFFVYWLASSAVTVALYRDE